MRKAVMGIALGLGLSTMVLAQGDASASIRDTISNQIEAFKTDDFATAFSFASPSIQMMFRNPDNFGIMVQRGYPMVWRPEDVTFGDLREVAGGLWQRVLIRDANGKVHALDYGMIETPDGWKINGVQFVTPPGVSA